MNATVEISNQTECRELMRLANRAAAELDACRETIAAASECLSRSTAGASANQRSRRREAEALDRVGAVCGRMAEGLLNAMASIRRDNLGPEHLIPVLAAARTVLSLLKAAEQQAMRIRDRLTGEGSLPAVNG